LLRVKKIERKKRIFYEIKNDWQKYLERLLLVVKATNKIEMSRHISSKLKNSTKKQLGIHIRGTKDAFVVLYKTKNDQDFEETVSQLKTFVPLDEKIK
jgi:hypothetical protein